MSEDAVDWPQRLLRLLGLPVSDPNVHFLRNWQRAEGGHAAHNPLNTTMPWTGATYYNRVGVKNYASVEDGLAATAATLQNRRYGAIRSALMASDAPAAAAAVEASPWGTHNIPRDGLDGDGHGGGGGVLGKVGHVLGDVVNPVGGVLHLGKGAAEGAADAVAKPLLRGAEKIVIEGLVVAAGVGLIVLGLYSGLSSTKTVQQARGAGQQLASAAALA